MAKSVTNVIINAKVLGNNQINHLNVDITNVQIAAQKANNSLGSIISSCGALTTSLQGLVSSLDWATEGYNSFDKAMRSANTIAGKDAAGFEKLKAQVSELGKSIPMTRDALADGLYQTIRSGVPEDNWLSFLNTSAKTAVGGMTDLGSVVTVTSKIIKDYGLNWDMAMAIQDKIQALAKNGAISFEQLQQALPQVTCNADSLEVSIDELIASFATLTGVSGNTVEVATQIGDIFSALITPSSEASQMAREMGIQFDAAAIQMAGGLQNFLTGLEASVKAYASTSGMLEQEIYGKLFGSAEAMRAIIPLTGELASTYTDNLNMMATSTGAVSEAFDKMAQAADSKAQLTKNAWADATDSISGCLSSIKPVIETMAQIGMLASGVVATNTAISKLSTSMASLATHLINNNKYAKFLYNNLILLRFIPIANTATGVKNLAQALNISARSASVLGTTLRWATAGGIGLVIWGICAAIEALKKTSSEAADEQTKLQNELNALNQSSQDISAAMAENAASEMANLEALMGVLRNSNESRDKQREALAALQEAYPDYFGKLDLEKSKVEDLETAYNNATTAIKKKAMAAAAQEKMTENAKKILELEEEKSRYTALAKAGEEQEEEIKRAKRGNGIVPGKTLEIKGKKYEMPNVPYQFLIGTGDAMKRVSEAKITEIDSKLSVLYGAQDYLTDIYSQNATSLNTKLNNKPPKKVLSDKEMAEKINVDEVRQRDLTTEDDFKGALSDLRLKKRFANKDERKIIKGLIADIEQRFKDFDGVDDTPTTTPETSASEPVTTEPVDPMPQNPIGEITDEVLELNGLQGEASDEAVQGYNNQIDALKELRSEMLGINDVEIKKKPNPFQDFTAVKKMEAGWGAIKGLKGDVDSLTAAFDNSATVWERVTSGIEAAFGMFDHIQTIVTLFDSLKKSQEAAGAAAVVSAGMQAAASETSTPALKEEANANMLDAGAKVMNAHSWIPFVGIALGAASVALMIASLFGLPKFANGGIAYGPTLGLFGEYAGARNNPEVVAPLNRLKDLIEPRGGAINGKLKFEIEGRKLVAVYDNEKRRRSRS